MPPPRPAAKPSVALIMCIALMESAKGLRVFHVFPLSPLLYSMPARLTTKPVASFGKCPAAMSGNPARVCNVQDAPLLVERSSLPESPTATSLVPESACSQLRLALLPPTGWESRTTPSTRRRIHSTLLGIESASEDRKRARRIEKAGDTVLGT